MSVHPFLTSDMSVGLFEGNETTHAYADRVDANVQALDKAALAAIVKRYGPDGLAASVTAAQLGQFQSDRATYQGWLAWKKKWDGFYASIKDSFLILSADTYRTVDSYAQEEDGWRKTLDGAFSLSVPAVVQPSALPGVIPATNANEPSALQGAIDGVLKIAAVAVGGYLAVQLIGAMTKKGG